MEKKIKKIHLKDYTNRLEKVLEKKAFSLQSKNLLLSMFYKIENAYNDYEKTKVEVYDKGEFLDYLTNIIETKCNEIEIVKFEEAEKINNYAINKETGKITTLGNEFYILNAIIELNQKTLCVPAEEEMLKEPISYFLNTGIRMHQTEIIRDFNGWSWDIVQKEITNIELNLIFQTFIYLIGYNTILDWIKNESPLVDYLILNYENLKQQYGEEKAKKIISLFCKFSIETYTKNNKEQKNIWENYKKENTLELEKLNDKTSYLDEITKQKKKYTKQIEKIDKVLNNKEELQKEYEKRNEKLPNKEKIFSIRHLINKLEIERQEYVDKIKECNILIEPKGYVARKDEVNRKVEFLNKLNLNGKDTRKNLLELCILFLSCMQIKIAKEQNRQELILYFYILRYYRFLIFEKEGTLLKDIEKLEPSFEKTIILLLEKAQKLNIIDNITLDEDINYQIIHKLFDTKMIDLNNIVIETKVEEGKLFATYYDTNIIENTYEIYSNKTVKLKKKVKLFM